MLQDIKADSHKMGTIRLQDFAVQRNPESPGTESRELCGPCGLMCRRIGETLNLRSETQRRPAGALLDQPINLYIIISLEISQCCQSEVQLAHKRLERIGNHLN